jgi:hypothetical protein
MNNGRSKHFFIAVMLIIYLLSAKLLFAQFFLRDGKPEQINVVLPAPEPAQGVAAPAQGEASTGYVYRLAHLRPVRHADQDLYELRGFAFPAADPQMKTHIQIVLATQDGNQLYSTATVPVASMLKSFDYPQAVAEQAEFSVLIAKQTLPPGNYQVGILLEEETGANRVYLLTTSRIEKTPNRVRYQVVN